MKFPKHSKTLKKNSFVLNVKILKYLICVFSFGLCAWQISRNVLSYYNRTIDAIPNIKEAKFLEFPQIIVCLTDQFNPDNLLRMGLDYSVKYSREEIKENILSFKGINKSTTGQELLDNAGWKLGEIVESVSVGDFYQKFDLSTEDAPLWERVFGINFSCFKFSPLPVNNKSSEMTLRMRTPSDYHYCVDSLGSVVGNSVWDCSNMKASCNMSCSWVSHINSIYYHVIAVSTEQSTKISRYYSVMYPGTYSGKFYITQLSYYFLSGKNYDMKSCYIHCAIKNYGADHHCHIINDKNLHLNISQYCKHPHVLVLANYFKECAENCPLQNIRKIWFSRISTATREKKIMLIFSYDLLKSYVETQSYTIFQLWSDIGGNMGFFMGLSLMTILTISFRKIRQCTILSKINETLSMKVTSRLRTKLMNTKIHMMELTPHCFKIVFLSICCIHIAFISYSYSFKNSDVFIRFEKSRCVVINDETKCVVEGNDWEWATGFMFFRVANCKIEVNKMIKCIVKCIFNTLEFYYTGVIPFESLQKLPTCNSTNLERIRYMIPPEILTTMNYLDHQKNFRCRTNCLILESTEKNPPLYTPKMHIVSDSQLMISYICSLSGIIGLYFSSNLIDIVGFIFKVIIKNITILKLIAWSISILVFIFAFAIILSRMFYLMTKDTYTTSVETTDEQYLFMTFTVCPQLKSGLNLTEHDKKKVFDSISFVCKILQKSFVPLRRLNYQFTGYDCFTCVINESNVDPLLDKSLSLDFKTVKNKYLANFFLIIHHIDDDPVWDGTYDYLVTLDRMLLTKVSSIFTYSRDNSKVLFSTCYKKCLDNLNITQGITDKNSLIFDLVDVNNCKSMCETNSVLRYLTFRTNREIKANTFIVLRFRPDWKYIIMQRTRIKQIENFKVKKIETFQLMVNEFSSVLGFFVGISIYSFILVSTQNLLKIRNE